MDGGNLSRLEQQVAALASATEAIRRQHEEEAKLRRLEADGERRALQDRVDQICEEIREVEEEIRAITGADAGNSRRRGRQSGAGNQEAVQAARPSGRRNERGYREDEEQAPPSAKRARR